MIGKGRVHLRKNWTDNPKKVSQSEYFLCFLHLDYFYIGFFNESVENFISNKMIHEKSQLDKNYRFFMVGIDKQILFVFSYFCMI